MASEDSGLRPLSLNLYRDDDDEVKVFHKKRLECLVNGEVTPSQAAADLDAFITEEANVRFEELMKRPDPRNLTPEEEKQGVPSMRAIAPNPTGNIEDIFASVAKLCAAFPPYSIEQDRIVKFLEALRAIPEHEVYRETPPEDPNEPYATLKLWPFGGNWQALAEIFRHEAHDNYSYPYSDIETPGSDVQLRWRNLSSAMARLTALELIDCGFLCALGDILPASPFYPDLEERKIGGPNRISGDVIAGAQWLLWPDEGRYVYQQCKKVETISGPRTMWSMERWNQWKDQLKWVAEDERFGAQARHVARMARHQMMAYEKDACQNGS